MVCDKSTALSWTWDSGGLKQLQNGDLFIKVLQTATRQLLEPSTTLLSTGSLGIPDLYTFSLFGTEEARTADREQKAYYRLSVFVY